MVDVLIICMARHEAAAAMIIGLINKGSLNYIQSIVAVIIIMLIPCYANVGAIIKEIGWKQTLVMVVNIYLGSLLVAGSLNWILVNIL